MSIIDDIKANYPHPSASKAYKFGIAAYCVGGACCLYQLLKIKGKEFADSELYFPVCGILSHMLQEINPALSWSKAIDFAEQIIISNDKRDFAQAWDSAAAALEYQLIAGE